MLKHNLEELTQRFKDSGYGDRVDMMNTLLSDLKELKAVYDRDYHLKRSSLSKVVLEYAHTMLCFNSLRGIGGFEFADRWKREAGSLPQTLKLFPKSEVLEWDG